MISSPPKNDGIVEKHWESLPGPQTLFIALTSVRRYRELGFGGARGPGKTEASIAVMGERNRHRRYRGLVVRRNADDLKDYEARCQVRYECFGMKLRKHPMTITFPSKAQILGGHLGDDDAYTKYQGHEYQRIGLEELTQIPSEKLYKQLTSSCRSSIPELYAQVISTFNPGGRGHAWVYKRFVRPIDFRTEKFTKTTLENGDTYYESERIEWWAHNYYWYDKHKNIRNTVWNEIFDKEEKTWRVFVPATIDDNPVLLENDPDYVHFLEGLKTTDEALYLAWRYGQWEVFVGQVFTEFNYEKHVVGRIGQVKAFEGLGSEERRKMFDESSKIISMDWGYADETAIYWNAWLDNKQLVTYRELVGNKTLAAEWGKRIRETILASGERVDFIVLPDDMESKKNGKSSPKDDLMDELKKLPLELQPELRIMSRERGSRAIRQHVTHKQLMAEYPAQILSSCKRLVEAIPALVYDEKRKEEIDTLTDHEYTNPYDGWSYGLRWIDERLEGELLNATKRTSRAPKSMMIKNGRTEESAKDIGLDTDSIIKKSLNKGGNKIVGG